MIEEKKFDIPDYLDYRKPESINKKEKKERDCMMCYKPFKSEGNHNRICWQCKNTDDWYYGNDYGLAK